MSPNISPPVPTALPLVHQDTTGLVGARPFTAQTRTVGCPRSMDTLPMGGQRSVAVASRCLCSCEENCRPASPRPPWPMAEPPGASRGAGTHPGGTRGPLRGTRCAPWRCNGSSTWCAIGAHTAWRRRLSRRPRVPTRRGGCRRPYPAGRGVPSRPRAPRKGPGGDGQRSQYCPGKPFPSGVVRGGDHEHLVVELPCLG